MRVLITGLNGFTGQYLAAALRRDSHEVFDLGVDLCDADAVMDAVKRLNPEWVVHLAAISFVAHHDIQKIYDVNLFGTRNLLAALEKQAPAIKSILLASSANVYGNSIPADLDLGLDENCLPIPANDYAISKLSMEYVSRLWANRLPIFITRPFNYTGVGQHKQFLIPKIISHFKNKADVIELGNINVSREFNDVRWIADVYTDLLKQNPLNKTLNICTGKAYTLNQIIDMCVKLTGHEIEIKVNPEFVRPDEVVKLVGNNSLFKSIITDTPTYLLEDTLRWMLDV